MSWTRYVPPLVAVFAGATPFAAAATQTLALRHQLTMYADEKDVGFLGPEGVACNDSGAVVVSDTRNGRLVRFTLKGKDLAGGVPVQVNEVQRPGRAQLDRAGGVIVLDEKSRSLVRVDAKGAFAGRVAFQGEPTPDGIVPVAFKIDGAGDLYVLDVASRRVLLLDPSDKVVRTIDLPRDRTMAFTDVAVDKAGTIYALEAVGAAVWSAQKGASSFRQLSQSLKDYMSFPVSLAVYGGALIVIDQHGNGIVSVGFDGGYRGRQLAMGWGEGLVYYPSQLCVTEKGELFLADRGNNRVQLFTVVR